MSIPDKRRCEDVPRVVILNRLYPFGGCHCPFGDGVYPATHCALRWLHYRDKRHRDYRLRCPVDNQAPPECPLREGMVKILGIEAKEKT